MERKEKRQSLVGFLKLLNNMRVRIITEGCQITGESDALVNSVSMLDRYFVTSASAPLPSENCDVCIFADTYEHVGERV